MPFVDITTRDTFLSDPAADSSINPGAPYSPRLAVAASRNKAVGTAEKAEAAGTCMRWIGAAISGLRWSG